MLHRIAPIAMVFTLASIGCNKASPEAGAAAGTGRGASSAATAAETAVERVEPWCGAKPCPCKAGTERKSGDKLSGCQLDAPATIQGLAVQKNVSFDSQGYLTQFDLAKEAKIGPVTCKAETTVTAYGPGKLDGCYTNGTATIDDVACKGNISMTKSGKLRRCQLVEAKAFGDLQLKAEDWLTVYESGKPERFESGNVIEVQGRKCKGYFNYLHESGKLKKCEVAEDTKLDGKDYKAGTAVCFDEQGKVADCSSMQFKTL